MKDTSAICGPKVAQFASPCPMVRPSMRVSRLRNLEKLQLA